MLKYKSQFCLIPTAIVAFNVAVASAPAQANCGNEIVKLELV